MKRCTKYGVTGFGTTVKEAKEVIAKRIENAFTGSYQPYVYYWREMVGFVFRNLQGWNYTLGYQGITDMPCIHSCGNLKEAKNACRRHLAQVGWKPGDGFENIPEILQENPEKEQKEFLHWARWQVRYAIAESEGLSDADCRLFAASEVNLEVFQVQK